MIEINRDRPREAQDERTMRSVAGAMTSVELNRLRWRCRRGMLENDLILARYLDARGARLSEAEVVQLDSLLQLGDGALWDLISGRTEPTPDVEALVRALRES